METNPEISIDEVSYVPKVKKFKKQSKKEDKMEFIIENEEKETDEIAIKYNDNTYCIDNPNKEIIIKKNITSNVQYLCNSSNKNKYCITFRYINIEITLNIKSSGELLLLYVILQHHYSVINIHELVNIWDWDYNLWYLNISSLIEEEELSDHLILLNCFLNLKDKYNTPIEISELENDYKLKIKDKRGLGGERPRELNYKYGFPYFTSSTKKYLNNSQRIFICPFPIENINPQRKAIVNNKSIETKCFTCGNKDGEINIFGQICNFEKGHLTPIKCENTTNSHWQCKWCNTFYKDKIIWNDITNKPEFNYYAIIRDMKKTEIISILKQLGIQSSDL